jgi:hypothetical protein
VKTPIDVRLREEAARYAFRFACEDCIHFNPQRERCSLAFPPSPRRGVLDLAVPADGLELCKSFELG